MLPISSDTLRQKWIRNEPATGNSWSPVRIKLEILSFAEVRRALPDIGVETAIVRGGFPELECQPRY
jgi:hypothetical protein